LKRIQYLPSPAPVFSLAGFLFFAGLALAPAPSAAQHEPAQLAAAQSHSEKVAHGQAAPGETQGLTAQPGHVKEEEEEEHNLFRHTTLVQSISDSVFHDDKNATDPEKIELRNKHIEKTARSFEWINASIILLCIIIPLAKVLPRMMRKRSISLSQNLENARKTSADANARLSAVEAQLSRLDEEIARIRAQVEEESRHDEARIKASIGEERTRIVASAEQEINAAAAQARRSLRHFAADLAIEQAARQLVLTPDTDRALIAEFIREAHSESGNRPNGAASGGKN